MENTYVKQISVNSGRPPSSTYAGQQLSDPYGDDDVDMPVHHFVTFALKSSLKILAADPDEVVAICLADIYAIFLAQSFKSCYRG